MKTFNLIVFSTLLFLSASAQNSDGEAYYGNIYVRAVMGGGQKVNLDSVTSPTTLINRFVKPWKFENTYKAYWIGYTDDMYSIAYHGDSAITPLTNFIDTSRNLQARVAGLYTLHLIGIQGRVVGRFIEDFENKNARNALLKYLTNDDLNSTVLTLLMRDPWLSDIPKLMEYLSLPNRDQLKIIIALQRYNFDGKPLQQKITDSVFQKQIQTKTQYRGGSSRMYELAIYQKYLAPNFIIDDEIIGSRNWKETLNRMRTSGNLQPLNSVEFFFRTQEVFSFSGFDESYNYSLRNHVITIYGPIKARQIWLDW
jgi:hypothetical protein